MPLISFVMPTKNRVAWFPECVYSLLSQTEKDIEIVIVNDGSTDGTKDLLDNFYRKFDSRIVIAHNDESIGAGMSRNKGIDLATAPIIGVCDDDDIYDADRAKHILEFFEKNPKNVMMNAPYQRIGFNDEPLEEFTGMEFDEDLFKKTGAITFFSHPTAAYTKEDILSIGGYKSETKTETDDYQLVKDWIAAGKKIGFDGRYLVCGHRVMPSSIMASMRGYDPAWAGK